MKIAVRTAKVDTIKHQLISVMGLRADAISESSTRYNGITTISVSENAMSKIDSIRNIEAILLNEADVAELLQQTTIGEAPSLNSLTSVDENERYEHLSQLLHIRKATRDNR